MRLFLYFLARIMGDVNAVKRGPKAVVKRVERRLVGRVAGRVISKLFR